MIAHDGTFSGSRRDCRFDSWHGPVLLYPRHHGQYRHPSPVPEDIAFLLALGIEG